MKLKQGILIVGQTPPPFGGQAIMIQNIVEFTKEFGNAHHVRMGFAKDMDDIGRFRISKIFELGRIIRQVYYLKITKNIDILYYPAAGNVTRGVLYRDFILLGLTRFLFKKIIFHFHAAGLSELYSKTNWLERFLINRCFGRPDCSIILSKLNKIDAELLDSKKIAVIPYGIEDNNDIKEESKNNDKIIEILFVGVVRESKGIWVLLESVKRLHQNNIKFNLNIIGKLDCEQTEVLIKEYLIDNNLVQSVNLLGVRTGDDKWKFYRGADIFCFPSHFECEGLPVVCIEAMMYGIPIVSTNWRGIPDLVKDNYNGFLCPIKNDLAVAERLQQLVDDKSMRQRMGENSRKLFLKEFSFAVFKNKIIEVFENC